MTERKTERVFLTTGKNNAEDRMHFVSFWAQYVKTHADEDWSRQQKKLIDAQIQNARDFNKKTKRTIK